MYPGCEVSGKARWWSIQIDLDLREGVWLFTVHGGRGVGDWDRLGRMLEQARAGRPGSPVVLDVSETTFVDGRAATALLESCDAVVRAEGRAPPALADAAACRPPTFESPAEAVAAVSPARSRRPAVDR